MKHIANNLTDRYNKNMTKQEVMSYVAREIGSIKTKKKAIASRKNGKLGGRPPKNTSNKKKNSNRG